jgi:hypothetical protein
MQPTYLPWLGYFEMIKKVDKFYFLNNVEFNKKSWQNRNFIKLNGEKRLLSVPVKKNAKLSLVSEIEIDYSQFFPRKHFAAIQAAYGATSYVSEVLPMLEECYLAKPALLQDLNISWIESVCQYLEISTPLFLASDLKSVGKSTKLTVSQCVEVGATEFYCAKGAMGYVSLEEGFANNRIKVTFQDFETPVYNQPGGNFIPQLSAIDALFNCGTSTRELLL